MADLHVTHDPLSTEKGLAHPTKDHLNQTRVDLAPGSAALDENDRDRRSMVDANEPPPVAEASQDRRDLENARAVESNHPVTLRQGNNLAPHDAPQLFSDFDIDDLRSRWSNVQAGFVDSPRRSVQQADELVAAVMQRIANGFAHERSSLEKQWDRGDNVSTEELRVALQRYRAFFARLLNAA
jgi:hypothetical protein